MQFLHEGQWVDVPEHIVDLIRRDERAKSKRHYYKEANRVSASA